MHHSIYCYTVGLARTVMRFAPSRNTTGQNPPQFDQYREQSCPNLNLGGVGHGSPPSRSLPQRVSVSQLASQMLSLRWGADKYLARQGSKQATATKLGIYSKYSLRSSIHFLSRCSNFCKPLKKKSEYCPSNQISAATMSSASDEKWRTFNCFFNPENRW